MAYHNEVRGAGSNQHFKNNEENLEARTDTGTTQSAWQGLYGRALGYHVHSSRARLSFRVHAG